MRRYLFVLPMVLLASFATADEKPAKVRVLLVSAAPSREVQFLRAALQRDPEKTGVALTEAQQGADPKLAVIERGNDRILTYFPDRFSREENEPADKALFNLASYDVIVAADVDWTRLEPEAQKALKRWNDMGGSLIVLAGNVNTPKLAAPAFREATATVRDLLPVVPDDIRLRALDVVESMPRRLTIHNGELAWLQLNADPKGWETFFGNDTDKGSERGFYAAYPVLKVKAGAVVLATWGKDTPYVVRSADGAGRVLYVGGEELWRIRQMKADWHESLWLRTIREFGPRR